MTEASSSEVEANADAKAVKGPPPTAVRLREELTKLVVADLLGPKGGDEEEVDESRVSDRYVLGMLAPKRPGRAAQMTAKRNRRPHRPIRCSRLRWGSRSPWPRE